MSDILDAPAGAPFSIDTVFSFRSSRLAALSRWWHGKHEALGRLPARADMHPREIKDALPIVALFDVLHAPELMLRNRLLGSAISAFAGKNVLGTVWTAKDENPIAPRYFACVQEVLARGGPVRMCSRYAASKQVNFAQGENFFAPLSNAGRGIDMILLGADLLAEDPHRGTYSLLGGRI